MTRFSHAGGVLHDMAPTGTGLEGTRIAIVGAGVLGASIALRLAQSGAGVTVFERGFPGSGTSFSSFAWVNFYSKAPRAFHQLHVDALLAHERLARETGGDWLLQTGSLHWGAESAEFGDLEQTVATMRSWGARVESLSDEELGCVEPDLRRGSDVEGPVYHLPDGAIAHTTPMVGALLRSALSRYSAELRSGEVVRLLRRGEAVGGVELSDGSVFEADLVIVTAGVHTSALLGTVDVRARVERQPGTLVITEPAPVNLRSVVMAPELSLRPAGGGRIMIGTRSLSEMSKEDIEAGQAHQLRQALSDARELLPGLAGVPISSVRYGVRPIPEGGDPIVGFDPGVSGLYHATAHNAVTLGPVLADLIAADLTGFEPEQLRGFRPSRFDR